MKLNLTPEQERRMHELERVIKQQIHEDIGARWYEDHSPKIEKEKKQWKSYRKKTARGAEMNLKEAVHAALMTVAPTAPVESSQYYGGTAATFITFSRYNRMGEVYAENKEIETGHYFLVHL